jgi:hydroxypyruvate isomerase
MGLESVELCDPKFWPELKKLGLVPAIASSHGFARGFANLGEHEECLAILRKRIDECAAAGVERVITFSGFRRGISDEQGIRNMVEGLKKIVGYAESRKVTLCLEMLNSRVAENMKGHPDYFCDDLERSVEICRQIGSERMKVLFDLYHVQIMHGDLVTRIKRHAAFIGHVHTAGVPGRGEIDDTQEINYPPLMQALLEVGYKGVVGQEFIPVRDKIASLAQGVRICDV